MEDNAKIPWGRLVAQALVDPEQVATIFEVLHPILRKLARNLSAVLCDDALQAAQVAIWRALPKVDLTRGRSIRSMLLRTAYYAMRDEIRREVRRSRVPLDHFRSRPIAQSDEDPQCFGGLLDRYAEFVRQTGSFRGAHRYMARELGVSAAKTTSDFHLAARQYIDREGLCRPKQQYADVVEKILQAAEAAPDEAV